MKRAADWTHAEEQRSAKHGSPKPSAAPNRPAQLELAAEQSPEGPHPASQITCHPEHGPALVHGVDAKRGQRPYMEDTYQISSGSCAGAVGNYTLCSVFDGHGGTYVAHHCASNIAQRFSSCIDSSSGDASGAHAAAPEAVAQALKSSLSSLHNELKAEREAQLCGTTATACVLTPSHIIVASCGDSRAVIAKGGVAHQPIEDHSLQRADERERIIAAGGRLIWNNGLRVMGALGMSRALGDHLLQAHGVSAEPDVALLPRSGGEDFLLLATDGLWGAVSNEEAVEVAYRVLGLSRFTRPRAMAAIPCVLTALATRRGSTDNITVLCIDLAPPQPMVTHTEAAPAHQQAQAVPRAASGAPAAAGVGVGPVPSLHPGMRTSSSSRPCPPVVLPATPPPCVEMTQAGPAVATEAAPAAAGGAQPIPIAGRRSASSPLPRGLVAAAASFVAPTTPSPPRRPNRTVTTGAGPVLTAPPAAPAGMVASRCGVEAATGWGSNQVAAPPAGASVVSSSRSSGVGDGSWPPTWGTTGSAWPPVPAASPFAGALSPDPTPGDGCATPWAVTSTGPSSRSNSSRRQEGSAGDSWLSLARSVSCSVVQQRSRGQAMQQGSCGGDAAAAVGAAGVGGRSQTPTSFAAMAQQQVVAAAAAAAAWAVVLPQQLVAAQPVPPPPAAVAAVRSAAAQPQSTCRSAAASVWAAQANPVAAASMAAQGMPVASWSTQAAAAAQLMAYGSEVQRRVSASSGGALGMAAGGGMQLSEAGFKTQHRSSGGGSMAAPSMLASVGSGLYKAGSGNFAAAAPLAKVSSGGFAVSTAVVAGGGVAARASVPPSGFALMSAGSSGNLGAHSMLRPARSLGPTGLLASARSGSASATGRTPEVMGVARRCSADLVVVGAAAGGLSEAERVRGVTSRVS